MRVDFHSHTFYSKDSLNRIRPLVSAARKAGLDRLVITDHNNLRGAFEAQKAAPDLIIVGEEIKTTAGELLAAFVTQEIPQGLEPFEVIRRLRDQGAFISVSHPFDPYRSGWTLAQLEELVPMVDAIEILNARALNPMFNTRAQEFARAHGLPGTAGSDAHLTVEVGKAALEVPDFSDADGLKRGIKEGTLVGGLSPAWVHFGSTWAKLVKVANPHEIELK